MSDHAVLLLDWYEECIRLARELTDVLRAERSALVACKMEDVAESTLRKEQLGRGLAMRRQRMRETMLRQFGTTDSETLVGRLPEVHRSRWTARQAEWSQTWEQLVDLGQQNQLLLKHSLKNLGQILEHFKRLLGEKPTYSAKGTRVDRPFQGKVIEGRY